MGFWDTAGGVTLGAAVALVGQWFTDRRAAAREKRADNHHFRERVIENLQDSIKKLWREFSTTPIVTGNEAPRGLTQAMVDASAWRSRLWDEAFATEIKTWMDQVAVAISTQLPQVEQTALRDTYRSIMQRLGTSLRELHKD